MEVVRLALQAPVTIGPRASAVLTDLLISSGVAVARTGSIVLDWPNSLLPFEEAAWSTNSYPLDSDPLAFAWHRVCTRSSGDPWQHPVDAVRLRIAEWVRTERMQITGPWPDGATCAIALVHEARPFDRPRGGLIGRLRRTASVDPVEPYMQVIAVEKRHQAASELRSVDLLDPQDRPHLRMLGFSLDAANAVQIASSPGFLRGTAFPSRGYDLAQSCAADWVELPLLGESFDAGLPALLEAGGGAVLSIPMERFVGQAAADALSAYDEALTRLRALGAWLTTPKQIAQRLYG